MAVVVRAVAVFGIWHLRQYNTYKCMCKTSQLDVWFQQLEVKC